ncbi:MAG: phosphoglucosamine mutase [Pirellulales bacterium]
MKNNALIVSVSGLRGIVGSSLNTDIASRYATAFALSIPDGPIVIGRDGRESGPTFASAITHTLRTLGRDVLDCGIAATPTVGIVVREEHASGGIQISASHNPSDYNGLKLFSSAGRVLPASEGAVIKERFESLGDTPPTTASSHFGMLRIVDGTASHVGLVADTVNVEAIRQHRPRVWLDSGHGAGSRVAKPLLEYLGCDLVLEGGTPDGQFEHIPEPTATNLAGLLPRIPASQADVGFFQDPDADRLAIATSDGHYIGEECTLALVVNHVLSKSPGPIVINCSTSMMSAQIASSYQVPCYTSAVGEANVVDMMLKEEAILGGEGNGGVIDPRVGLVRDSFSAMALTLDRMCASQSITSIDTLSQDLPTMSMKKIKLNLRKDSQKTALTAGMSRVEKAFPNSSSSWTDGLRLDWDDGWLLIRGSNTEPIVRIVAEAKNESAVLHRITRAQSAFETS